MYLKIWVLITIFCTCKFAAGRSVDKSAVELIYTSNFTYLRVVSNFVYVKLKSEWPAKIVLTETPFPNTSFQHPRHSFDIMESTPEPPLYQFSLRDYDKDFGPSEFTVNGHVHAAVETPEILSTNNFVEFLIYWTSDFLLMSRLGDPFPLFHRKESYPSNLQKIKYIGIRVDKTEFFLPPGGENCWMINFSSPINLSDAFAPFFKSSLNPLMLKTDLAVKSPETESLEYSSTTKSPE